MGLIQKLTPGVINENYCLIWDEPPSAMGQKWAMKCLQNMVRFITMERDCEMKISPVISINKKCHSHQ